MVYPGRPVHQHTAAVATGTRLTFTHGSICGAHGVFRAPCASERSTENEDDIVSGCMAEKRVGHK